MEISPDKTKELIDKYYKSREREILNKLQGKPDIQLKFIDEILQARKPTDSLDIQLVDLYIYLLCQYGERYLTCVHGEKYVSCKESECDNKEKKKKVVQKYVFQKLVEFDHSTEAVLNACRAADFKKACIFLELKSGGTENYLRALQYKFEVIFDCFSNKIK